MNSRQDGVFFGRPVLPVHHQHETMATTGIATDSEEQLLRRMQSGDATASRAVYNRYVRYLSAIVSRYITNDEDIKDVLQESFLKIFSSIATFTYRGDGSLKGWMSKIVLNETLRHIRGRTLLTELTPDNIDTADDEPETDDIPSGVIYNMIRDLPEGYRVVFNLYVIEGKSHKDIAAMLNIKENSSASQLHRAKAMLAAKINHYRKYNSASL